MEGWKVGRMVGSVEEWKGEKLEGWKVEEWKVERMEGLMERKKGRLES